MDSAAAAAAGSNLGAAMSQTAATALAPAPKACGNCARVKCKCIYRQNGDGCERCRRLNKQCTPSTLVRRHKQSKRLEASRAASLEDRFDELLSFLRSRNVLVGDVPSLARGDDVADDAPSPDPEYETEPERAPGLETGSPAVVIPTPGSSGAGSVSVAISTPASAPVAAPALFPLAHDPSDEPTALEAEESLRRFREDKALFFPFVYIPPYMTALQLRAAYPFLWLNIMCTAAASPRRRLALGDRIRSILFQRVVADREKSMDLLLGLLTLLAWSHLQRKDKIHTGLFSQLTVLMVYDLGLHKPPAEHVPRSTSCRGSANTRKDLTSEDRRAVLGAFLVTSMTSYVLNGAPGLNWSAHLDGYLAQLIQESALEQDKILVALVRMQLIVDQLQQRASSGPTKEQLPDIYLAALRAQLQAIVNEDGIDGPASSHPAVLQHFHFTCLLINEAATPATGPASGQQQQQQMRSFNEPDFGRFDVYQQQLNAVRSWLDVFQLTSFPLKRCMPFYSFAQLVRCMVSLHRLTLVVDDPCWDKGSVRRTLDLIPTLDVLIATFEHLRAATSLLLPDLGEDEAFMWGVVVFQNMKMVWRDEVAAASAAAAKVSLLPGGGASGAAGGFVDGGMQQAGGVGGAGGFPDGTGGTLTFPDYGSDGAWTIWMQDPFNF